MGLLLAGRWSVAWSLIVELPILTLHSEDQVGLAALVDILGKMFLPVLVLGIMRMLVLCQ